MPGVRSAVVAAIVFVCTAARGLPLIELRVERSPTRSGDQIRAAFALFITRQNSTAPADAVAVVHLDPLHLFNAGNVGESYYATSPQGGTPEDGLQATDSGFDGFIAALLDGSDDPLLAIQYSTSAIGDSIGLRESGGGYFPAYGYSVRESVAFEDLTPGQLASIRSIEFRADSFTSAYASGTFIFHDEVVPEPSTGVLVFAGLALLGWWRRT